MQLHKVVGSFSLIWFRLSVASFEDPSKIVWILREKHALFCSEILEKMYYYTGCLKSPATQRKNTAQK